MLTLAHTQSCCSWLLPCDRIHPHFDFTCSFVNVASAILSQYKVFTWQQTHYSSLSSRQPATNTHTRTKTWNQTKCTKSTTLPKPKLQIGIEPSKMSQPHAIQTVAVMYSCFFCGHWSNIRGLPRSPYPLWQYGLKCQQCRTQLVEGTWQEHPDSYGL
jgi:hypothetical protein